MVGANCGRKAAALSARKAWMVCVTAPPCLFRRQDRQLRRQARQRLPHALPSKRCARKNTSRPSSRYSACHMRCRRSVAPAAAVPAGSSSTSASTIIPALLSQIKPDENAGSRCLIPDFDGAIFSSDGRRRYGPGSSRERSRKPLQQIIYSKYPLRAFPNPLCIDRQPRIATPRIISAGHAILSRGGAAR